EGHGDVVGPFEQHQAIDAEVEVPGSLDAVGHEVVVPRVRACDVGAVEGVDGEAEHRLVDRLGGDVVEADGEGLAGVDLRRWRASSPTARTSSTSSTSGSTLMATENPKRTYIPDE